ncbi:MAG TPA: hypothetical protein VE242_01460 [Chthoniobacterales bacterium]|nr:hypothetical protein [Chthoniobacterales bacterium]
MHERILSDVPARQQPYFEDSVIEQTSLEIYPEREEIGFRSVEIPSLDYYTRSRCG